MNYTQFKKEFNDRMDFSEDIDEQELNDYYTDFHMANKERVQYAQYTVSEFCEIMFKHFKKNIDPYWLK